jgi:hypothetical protein
MKFERGVGMRLLKTKKSIALLATLVVVGAAAFGAYAYFTNTGSSASVKNNAASGNQELNTIVATITGVTSGSIVGPDACVASDFQFNSPTASWSGSGTQTATILPNDDLAAGNSYSISDLNVVLVDDGTVQDNCQGQSVTVTFNAS